VSSLIGGQDGFKDYESVKDMYNRGFRVGLDRAEVRLERVLHV
jgi:hypothetical protein